MTLKYTWISRGVENYFECHVQYDAVNGMYYATLLGGEFANTYGSGVTPDGAVQSLKIRVIQLRNKKNKQQK